MNPPLDWRNNPIEVGSVIVYATTASSSVCMNEAIVAKVELIPEAHYKLVDVPVLYVRKTIEHSYRNSPHSKKDQTKLQKLTRVDRVTVVEPRSEEKCNFLGCIAELDHADPANPYCWPAHSFEREE